jgi:hypothetical protein
LASLRVSVKGDGLRDELILRRRQRKGAFLAAEVALARLLADVGAAATAILALDAAADFENVRRYSCATLINAASNASGSALPRFPARRRIPLHAFDERKYRGGTGPRSRVSERDTNEEDPSPSLSHAEELGVEDSPSGKSFWPHDHTRVLPLSARSLEGHFLSNQSCKEAAECVVFCGQHSGDILPNTDCRRSPCTGSLLINGLQELDVGE